MLLCSTSPTFQVHLEQLFSWSVWKENDYLFQCSDVSKIFYSGDFCCCSVWLLVIFVPCWNTEISNSYSACIACLAFRCTVAAIYWLHPMQITWISMCVRVCVFLCVFLCTNVLLTAGLLDRLHSDDPVCACGFFHRRGLRPDDCVGQRQTPQLLKGVQRLSDSALLHTPLHPVEPWQRNPSIRSLIGFLSGGLYPVCAEVNSSGGFWSYGLHVTFSHTSLHNEELLWVLDWWMQDC